MGYRVSSNIYFPDFRPSFYASNILNQNSNYYNNDFYGNTYGQKQQHQRQQQQKHKTIVNSGSGTRISVKSGITPRLRGKAKNYFIQFPDYYDDYYNYNDYYY